MANNERECKRHIDANRYFFIGLKKWIEVIFSHKYKSQIDSNLRKLKKKQTMKNNNEK